jgi:Flp pilus assembly protein TadD
MRALCVLGLLLAAAQARADVEVDALTRLNAGVAHYQLGQLEEARADFITARDLEPNRANPHRWLGLTEARLDHCEAAVVELDLFLQSVPPRDPRVTEATAVRDLCKQKLAPPPPSVAAPVVVAAPPPPPPPGAGDRR